MASDKTSDKTQEYTLKVGSHTWIDGKTYTAGDPDSNKMQLTKEQMERIGKERFEGQTVDLDAQTQVAAELAEENKRLRAQIAQLQKQAGSGEDESGDEDESEDYTDLLSKSVPDIAKHLQSVHDVSALNSIQAAESKDGQPRVGVLKAIEARREELGNA